MFEVDMAVRHHVGLSPQVGLQPHVKQTAVGVARMLIRDFRGFRSLHRLHGSGWIRFHLHVGSVAAIAAVGFGFVLLRHDLTNGGFCLELGRSIAACPAWSGQAGEGPTADLSLHGRRLRLLLLLLRRLALLPLRRGVLDVRGVHKLSGVHQLRGVHILSRLAASKVEFLHNFVKRLYVHVWHMGGGEIRTGDGVCCTDLEDAGQLVQAEVATLVQLRALFLRCGLAPTQRRQRDISGVDDVVGSGTIAGRMVLLRGA
mmetsp:Transcript_40738/g.86829  ORF Transcript_40738/g.86829 Transcript_40738/m.86829 type:complete len:258 (+) Transcript_40738:608-1381(+)